MFWWSKEPTVTDSSGAEPSSKSSEFGSISRDGSFGLYHPRESESVAPGWDDYPEASDDMQMSPSRMFPSRSSTRGSFRSTVPRGPSFRLPSTFSPAEGLARHSSVDGLTMHEPFPIRRYIAECGLPIFHYVGKDSVLKEKERHSSLRWPKIASLDCLPLPRALKSIQRYASYGAMCIQNEDYYAYSDKPYLETHSVDKEFKQPLLLPCEEIAFFDDLERAKLSDLQNDAELCQMFHEFVLGTASAAARLLRCLDPDDPAHKIMALRSEFRIRNSLFLDPYRMWNIFTLMDPSDPETLPLVVIFIHPSNFGIEDFERFVRPRALKHDELDRPTTPADIIWAVVYEILKKGKGRKFVVTNYVRWAYGMFEPGYETASVTKIYEAKLTNYNNGNSAPVETDQKNSVLEMLIRWMETPLEKKRWIGIADTRPLALLVDLSAFQDF